MLIFFNPGAGSPASEGVAATCALGGADGLTGLTWPVYDSPATWPHLVINGHFRNRLIGGTDSIYKAYFLCLCKGISPQNMAKNMVQYLHFRILKFPLIITTKKNCKV